MDKFRHTDAGRRANSSLANVVDTGVSLYVTSGMEAAQAYFSKHSVPATIAVRVLFHANERRQLLPPGMKARMDLPIINATKHGAK